MAPQQLARRGLLHSAATRGPTREPCAAADVGAPPLQRTDRNRQARSLGELFLGQALALAQAAQEQAKTPAPAAPHVSHHRNLSPQERTGRKAGEPARQDAEALVGDCALHIGPLFSVAFFARPI